MIQECEYRGAKITLIKDDTTEKRRHVWANINGKTFAHLIENENGNLNVFRPEFIERICELCTSFELVRPQDVTGYLRKKDFE